MMRNQWFGNLRRLAPAGLYLAGLSALAAGVLYVLQGSLTLAVQISLSIIVVGLALFVLLDPQRTRVALTGRQARYGSNALLMTVAFTGILVVVNYLVSNNSVQWDLTEDQQNSLTAESVQALASLKSPVTALGFYSPQMPVESARSLLQNFKNHGDGNFDFELVDPVSDPIRAQQANVTRDGTIVLQMEGRQEQVSFASEEEITSALIRLANPGQRAVYFLTGHGEYVLDSSSEDNYNQVQTALAAKNYTINTLNLLATPVIPEDALAIVVAGPTKPISQQEVDLIKAYQEKGGSLIYLAEPRPVTEFGEQADPLAAYLEQVWSIQLDDNIVIDPSSNQPLLAISQRFGSHPVTQKMYSLVVVMPSARSVQVGEAPSGITLTPLAYSSDLAWGEVDIQSIEQGQMQPEEGTDVIGPVALAVAGENANSNARVLVAGDSDFAGSGGFSNYGNSDFILNSIDWAAEQDDLISLTAREPIQRFFAPPQRYTMGLILLGSIFLLPGLVVLAGVTVWIQRRRRG